MKALEHQDESIYYNIGHCLTDMGYASRALEYLNQSLAIANSKNNHDTVYTRYFIAENYVYTGRATEALEMLTNCLRDEKAKKDKDRTVATIQCRIGRAYAYLGNHKTALAEYEKIRKLTRFKSKLPPHVIYFKAISLNGCNRKTEALQCIDEGIIDSIDGSNINIALRTIKCLYTINQSDSVLSLINELIPSLISFEHNFLLIQCYEELHKHFSRTSTKVALDYLTKAYLLSEKLRKGDFE